MKVEFKKSFEKDLKKITDVNVLAKVKTVIEQIEIAVSLMDPKTLRGTSR